MEYPLASILICNYNYGGFIQRAIDSALGQTYPNFEVIVVDDGSTDNSRQVIAGYGDKVVAVFKENGGQASAFNEGFERSKGDIVFLLDSDDWFLPNKVERVIETFKSNPEIGWCFNSQVEVDVLTDQVIKRTAAPETGEPVDLRAAIIQLGRKPYFAPATSCTSFKRTVLSSILPMPTGQSVVLSDNYIKFAAVSLAKGYFLNEDLTCMGIHGSNIYTRSNTKDLIHAKVDILTAFWLRQNFPNIKNFTNRLFRTGLAYYWRCGKQDEDCRSIVKQYLSLTQIPERIEILAVALLHYSNAMGVLRRLKAS
ncbi:glycosyltransferase family A protein [Pseudanabaena sp. FACHB-2040]|uniref:glycosyltransferase family 2 protein n=1 Tax=Pseudanabaena sp. FACHB-2040 TaxID=2692859 RepID=UPI001689DCF8|nr:glycosyltransferase family A protein [Pseudanabaena sp. FACHB-2040]MBD2260580.1 glycosyltransferase family 2 protein [Pseudanabaena sp. FACHB-2040]